MSKRGRFEKGRYYIDGGAEEGKDGFETLWEECNKPRILVYPEGRYGSPVMMEPTAYSWKKQKGELVVRSLKVLS